MKQTFEEFDKIKELAGQHKVCWEVLPEYHRGRDSLHYICPRTVTPKKWQESQSHCHHSHHLGSYPLHRSFIYRFSQVFPAIHLSFTYPFFICIVKINYHYNPGLSRKPRDCNYTYPDCYTHVVTEKIHKPDTANQSKRNGENYNKSFCNTTKI